MSYSFVEFKTAKRIKKPKLKRCFPRIPSAPKIDNFAEYASVFAKSGTFLEIHKQIINHRLSKTELLQNPQL